MHRRIEERGAASHALGHHGRIEAAERAADEGHVRGREAAARFLDLADRPRRAIVQLRHDIAEARDAIAHVVAEHRRLARLRRADEPVEIHDRLHAAMPRPTA